MAEATAQTALGTAEAAGAVVWDGRSGSVVNAQVLGSAIEDFLARRGSSTEGSVPSSPAPGPSPSPSTGPGGQKQPSSTGKAAQGGKSQGGGGPAGGSWFSKEEDDASASDTCDSSICSTLKDLFVK